MLIRGVNWKWIGNIFFDHKTIKLMSGPNFKSNGQWYLLFINYCLLTLISVNWLIRGTFRSAGYCFWILHIMRNICATFHSITPICRFCVIRSPTIKYLERKVGLQLNNNVLFRQEINHATKSCIYLYCLWFR